MNKSFQIALALVAILATTAQTAQAQVMEQDQSQDLELNTEVVCETGSYGQPVNCTARADARGSQSQSQYIRLSDGRLIKTHEMADTGLDTAGFTSIMGLMTAGSVLAINKIKNRA